MKRVIRTGTDVISANIDVINNDKDKLQLSDCLKSLPNTVSKLQASRNTSATEISELNQRVTDNSSNIDRLKDIDFSDKNSQKHHLKDLRNELMEHVEQATAPLVSKSNHDASLKTLDHKLRPVEQKQP